MSTYTQSLSLSAREHLSETRSTANEAMAGMVCIFLCLLLNPFLALFFLSLFAAYKRVPTSTLFLTLPIAFALFFYFREYGVEWSPGSGDDVAWPGYLQLYNENYGIGFSEIFTRFMEIPGSYEPLWHIPWWTLLNVFGASDKTFIFIHYLVIFLAVFLALFALSRKYFLGMALMYFFATPLSIESVTFLWRQQLAFSMLLGGVGLYMARGRPAGKWLIYLSPFVHISNIFFVAIFVGFELYRKYIRLDSKLKFILIAVINLFAITIISPFAISYLGSLGMDRVASYLEGTGDDQQSVFISVGVYSAFLFLVHMKFRNDDLNSLFIVILCAVFGIMLAFPGASGIYIRFLIFAFPMYGLYFFRCYLLNFSEKWLVPVLGLVFISGAIRMYRPTLEDVGVVRFLAFGNAFDPSMGILKLLLNYWEI